MNINTKSGIVTVNKKTSYGKWLIGYTSTDAWTGWYTIEQTWEKNKDRKPAGCSWQAWGVICGSIINPMYRAIQEYKEELGEL